MAEIETEEFPVVNGLPLRLSFTPDAIREHFADDPGPLAQAVMDADDTVLEKVGEAALTDDRLYHVFHEVLADAVREFATREVLG